MHQKMETSKKMQTEVLKKPADVNMAELGWAATGSSIGPPWVHSTTPGEYEAKCTLSFPKEQIFHALEDCKTPNEKPSQQSERGEMQLVKSRYKPH